MRVGDVLFRLRIILSFQYINSFACLVSMVQSVFSLCGWKAAHAPMVDDVEKPATTEKEKAAAFMQAVKENSLKSRAMTIGRRSRANTATKVLKDCGHNPNDAEDLSVLETKEAVSKEETAHLRDFRKHAKVQRFQGCCGAVDRSQTSMSQNLKTCAIRDPRSD